MLIDKEVGLLVSGRNYLALYSVDAMDNSSYESQSTSIFAENEIIDRKQISKVVMRLTLADNSKSIEVQMLQSQEKNLESYITVSGDDPTWVNGIMTRFTEVINTCEPQPQYAQWMDAAGIVLLLIFWVVMFNIFVGFKPYSDEVAGILAILVLVGGILGVSKLTEYMKTLWPAMELQTGFGYQQIPAQKRNKVIWIMVTIVIPILLGGLYDLLKYGLGLI